ncbi:MAG: hypothetical protein NTV23_08515 [Propionibacteriales bacterium]|nr:hypothetical protein [Propionibacteriales bacterium]
MAGVSSKGSVRTRLARKVGGVLIDDLTQRIGELEAEIQENRHLNLRLAELIDVVSELLVPVASQDQAKIAAAVEKFQKAL